MSGAPLALLRRLVATPSVSGDEAAVADIIIEELGQLGGVVQREGDSVWLTITGDRAGDRAGDSPDARPHLLLNSHLDTVPPSEGWEGDPWTPRWDGERLTGLGANDAKGCVTAMLHGTRRLLATGWRPSGRLTLAFTTQEETGGDGIRAVLPRLGRVDAALVGEPTSLRPCTAQRGILILRCDARGTSGHVAHAGAEGVHNAIHKAARDIARLDALRFEPHPLLGETRAQVTTIEGGLRRNQIPDRCTFYVDLRTTPDLDHATVAEEIAATLESEVTVHSMRYLPKHTATEQPIVAACLGAAGVDEPVGSRTASDWAFLKEIPTVKVGPGDTTRSHRPNEYLTEKELEAGVAFYERVLRAYL